jgi:hypothetical protein
LKGGSSRMIFGQCRIEKRGEPWICQEFGWEVTAIGFSN